MPLFLATLREGGPAFTVQDVGEGFVLERTSGHEAEFNDVARRCVEKAGPTFAAFPRSDGLGGYDQVLIIPVIDEATGV